MPRDLQRYSDLELIKLFTIDPMSADGRVAEALLQYRQYLATKRTNVLLLVLTAALTFCTVLQTISAMVQAYPIARQLHAASSGHETNAPSKAP